MCFYILGQDLMVENLEFVDPLCYIYETLLFGKVLVYRILLGRVSFSALVAIYWKIALCPCTYWFSYFQQFWYIFNDLKVKVAFESSYIPHDDVSYLSSVQQWQKTLFERNSVSGLQNIAILLRVNSGHKSSILS